jgi:CRISPR system Cascade subunit CasE
MAVLHRIHLNPRNKDVRRDLADPYQLFSTLCRAFSPPERHLPAGELLWRLEPETDASGASRVLVLAKNAAPDWSGLLKAKWLAREPELGRDLSPCLNSLAPGMLFRFRLRANPSVSRNRKRVGLLKAEEQEEWLIRKGRERHGFSLGETEDAPYVDRRARCLDIRQTKMISARKHGSDQVMRVFSALFEGILRVEDAKRLSEAILSGIGHAKALGLGMLSVAPLPRTW